MEARVVSIVVRFHPTNVPILADVGIEFSGAPEVFEVHSIIRR
jgi:hypothetical protein